MRFLKLCAFLKAFVCLPFLLLHTCVQWVPLWSKTDSDMMIFSVSCLSFHALLPSVVLTYCHKRQISGLKMYKCVCVLLNPRSAPLNFTPTLRSTVWLQREIFHVCFCTESVYLNMVCCWESEVGEKSHFDHACFSVTAFAVLRPLDPGAHVVPKTQFIRSCKHTEKASQPPRS